MELEFNGKVALVTGSSRWMVVLFEKHFTQKDARWSSMGVAKRTFCGKKVVLGAPITYSVAKAALNAYVCGIARPLGKGCTHQCSCSRKYYVRQLGLVVQVS